MKLEGVREKVFLDRYSLKDKAGKPVEKTPEEMWRRVARGIASVEKPKLRKQWENTFYHAMEDFKFVPGGRVLAGAGTGYAVTFYNCFVIPSPKDSRGGILETLKQMVEIMAHGGGVGINLSSLRPRGFRVKKVNGFSSGPCNWAELFSVATKDIIQQGGSRRGALMLMLWDWHPDIEEFITVKQDLTRINGANLSVCASDEFMEAVKKDTDWDLVFPDTSDPDYDTKWDGIMANWKKLGKKVKVYKTVKAKHLWDLICQAAWRSAEPGLVFMERYNKWYNNWYWNTINCVNPCVTGDTLVSTTKGLRSMRELYEEGLPFRVIVNNKDYLSTHVKLTGVKKVYKLRTREGYELRLTKDHKVVTTIGGKEAGKLVLGDKIVLSTGGAFGTNGTLDEGRVLGWLVGDGSVKEDVATLFFYRKEKQELAPMFAQMVAKMVDGEERTTRSYAIDAQYIDKEDKAVVESVRLWRIANRYGITHANKYIVPEQIFKGSEEMQRGFLQGLFSSDGSVQGIPRKGVSVRLTSISKDLLIGVQKLLLNFGIVSKLYKNRRVAQERLLPDGKGGYKPYACKAYHELVVAKDSLVVFSALVGFLQEEKQEKLRTLLSLYKEKPYKQPFAATFSSLEEDGVEEVFDITVASIHRFVANGLMVFNCGEEGLPAWGVCNLASLNLSAFVKGYSVDKPGTFDYESLAEHARIGVRFQDDVVDADQYVYPQIKEMQLNGERRIGLGTLGLADALIKMHLRYGSEEAQKVVDKIYQTIRDSAYDESVNIAKEKGAFPKINNKKHLKGHFISQLPDSIKKKLSKYGVRNSMLLQAAPTGTTSLLSGASSGIEPVYEFEYTHNGRLGKQVVYHSLYGEWKKKHPDEKRPDYFVAANDLTPEDHVKIQAIVQKYVDASISKTVNAPNAHTVEDVKRLYMSAYDLGCKGITYMRDGSRQGVLQRVDDKKEQAQEKPVTVGAPIVRRPMVVEGVTYQTHTPIGEAFVTINHNEKGEPFEVFITIGKSGSDIAAMAEALGRIVSLNLRLHGALTARERIRQVVAQLIGIGGAGSVGFGKERVRSLPDAVAKVLAHHYGFRVNGKVEDKEVSKDKTPVSVTNGASNGHTNGSSEHSGIVMMQQMAIGNPISTDDSSQSATGLFDICPDCGSGTLAYEEGCKKCYSCGYSAC